VCHATCWFDGVWGLVWILGMTASFNVYPQLVGDSGSTLERA
jgi:hypothetical protein